MKKKIFTIAFCTLFLFSSMYATTIDAATAVTPCFIFDDLIEGY